MEFICRRFDNRSNGELPNLFESRCFKSWWKQPPKAWKIFRNTFSGMKTRYSVLLCTLFQKPGLGMRSGMVVTGARIFLYTQVSC